MTDLDLDTLELRLRRMGLSYAEQQSLIERLREAEAEATGWFKAAQEHYFEAALEQLYRQEQDDTKVARIVWRRR